ncbi:MAG TPA: hypothetical protein DER17_06700 [Oscillibacter sp.]|nr:hypothetical protein [Oscillibacter sp.]
MYLCITIKGRLASSTHTASTTAPPAPGHSRRNASPSRQEAVCTTSARHVSCTSVSACAAVTAPLPGSSFFTISGSRRLISGTSFFHFSMPSLLYIRPFFSHFHGRKGGRSG